jgi:hypothetical protein
MLATLSFSCCTLEFAPSGYMTMTEFKKALEFDKDDVFAARLFSLFASDKSQDEISMDDFIVGVSKVAPGMILVLYLFIYLFLLYFIYVITTEADINVKLDLCYELFDRDDSGSVMLYVISLLQYFLFFIYLFILFFVFLFFWFFFFFCLFCLFFVFVFKYISISLIEMNFVK